MPAGLGGARAGSAVLLPGHPPRHRALETHPQPAAGLPTALRGCAVPPAAPGFRVSRGAEFRAPAVGAGGAGDATAASGVPGSARLPRGALSLSVLPAGEGDGGDDRGAAAAAGRVLRDRGGGTCPEAMSPPAPAGGRARAGRPS